MFIRKRFPARNRDRAPCSQSGFELFALRWWDHVTDRPHRLFVSGPDASRVLQDSGSGDDCRVIGSGYAYFSSSQ